MSQVQMLAMLVQWVAQLHILVQNVISRKHLVEVYLLNRQCGRDITWKYLVWLETFVVSHRHLRLWPEQLLVEVHKTFGLWLQGWRYE